MISWKNLDMLPAYGKLKELKNHVNLQTAMAGENGPARTAQSAWPNTAFPWPAA